ncbi:MAG: hydantoinase/oxoprolinase family protein [Gammaproteobacteria bacterium]
MMIIGIDTGGTFTDFVAWDGASCRVHKELSTPQAPDDAIMAGLRALEVPLDAARIVHGSTVATNTLLEGKGARVVFVTNRGFGDILTIARQARAKLYELMPRAVPPPVPATLCLETGGRLGADGEVIDTLTEADMQALVAAIEELEPQAVAVSLLFSFLDDRFEREIATRLPADSFVSRSSEILPEYREYERGMATWLNAATGPVMQRYLERLATALAPAPLSIMQSSGVTAEPAFAARRAVNLLLSGPAGGLTGARHIAVASGHERIMSFDMGGTSTDVALIDGDIALTSEGTIGPYPVAVPMVDMHTIGAGGGSIAVVDAGGVLHVGPESAGAQPGPACYGQGGESATVTDANVVLGRMPAALELGGRLKLDAAAARDALTRLARALGADSAETAAQGVIAIANEHMAQALRVISVERGIDPRDFSLVSFGGAGGLHVCALADVLGMRRALVPAAAGVLSALGMVVARPGRRLSHTVRLPLLSVSAAAAAAMFEAVAAPGKAALIREGHTEEAILSCLSVDVCYVGQSFALTLPWSAPESVARAFHEAHEQRYGHRLDAPVELVNVRVALDVAGSTTALSALDMPAANFSAAATATPIHARAELAHGRRITGPAIICDMIATTHIDKGWGGACDDVGNLHLERLS